jgi:hypothetical protein
MPPAPLALVDPLFDLSRAPRSYAAAALVGAVGELDRFGIARAGIAIDVDPELARAALELHPERFFARAEVDPRAGMDALRRLERLAREWPLRAVTLSPARLLLPLDDKRCFPLFAKCCELDLVLCPRLGVPAERVPFSPQRPERLDAVACAFPELRIVMRGDLAPWSALAVWLMRRHPNLHAAASGTGLPPEWAAFANEDGALQLLFASDGGAEAAVKDLPGLGLARPVWPRFLAGNALRVFRLGR